MEKRRLPYSPFVITGYGGYFLLGYYLAAYPLAGRLRRAAYLLALLSAGLLPVGKYLLGMELSVLEIPLGLPSCSIAIGMFSLMQQLPFGKRAEWLLGKLGPRMFGVYLTHVLWVTVLFRIVKVRPDYCQPALAIGLSSVGIFLASYLFSCGAAKIPVIRDFV